MKFVIELSEGEEFTNFDLAKEIYRVCNFKNKLSAFAIAQMILIQAQEDEKESYCLNCKCEE
jgi:hypothetical protein